MFSSKTTCSYNNILNQLQQKIQEYNKINNIQPTIYDPKHECSQACNWIHVEYLYACTYNNHIHECSSSKCSSQYAMRDGTIQCTVTGFILSDMDSTDMNFNHYNGHVNKQNNNNNNNTNPNPNDDVAGPSISDAMSLFINTAHSQQQLRRTLTDSTLLSVNKQQQQYQQQYRDVELTSEELHEKKNRDYLNGFDSIKDTEMMQIERLLSSPIETFSNSSFLSNDVSAVTQSNSIQHIMANTNTRSKLYYNDRDTHTIYGKGKRKRPLMGGGSIGFFIPPFEVYDYEDYSSTYTSMSSNSTSNLTNDDHHVTLTDDYKTARQLTIQILPQMKTNRSSPSPDEISSAKSVRSESSITLNNMMENLNMTTPIVSSPPVLTTTTTTSKRKTLSHKKARSLTPQSDTDMPETLSDAQIKSILQHVVQFAFRQSVNPSLDLTHEQYQDLIVIIHSTWKDMLSTCSKHKRLNMIYHVLLILNMSRTSWSERRFIAETRTSTQIVIIPKINLLVKYLPSFDKLIPSLQTINNYTLSVSEFQQYQKDFYDCRELIKEEPFKKG